MKKISDAFTKIDDLRTETESKAKVHDLRMEKNEETQILLQSSFIQKIKSL